MIALKWGKKERQIYNTRNIHSQKARRKREVEGKED